MFEQIVTVISGQELGPGCPAATSFYDGGGLTETFLKAGD